MSRKHISKEVQDAETVYWSRFHDWQVTITAKDSRWSDMKAAADKVYDAGETWAKALARAYSFERKERVSLTTARQWVAEFVEAIKNAR